jgi:hypothetical protein
MRYLMYSVDRAPAAPPSPEMLAELGKFNEDVKRAGVLLATGGLGAESTRVRNAGGKLSVTDGPFTETKELTGGFALLECKSHDEAIEWARRFRKIVGDGESIVQEVFGG